tara:strand:+ start:163949 stop:164650 length:702 start_codon:yes stop_codon:yes gene_type:complete
LNEITDPIALQKILQREKSIDGPGEMWVSLEEQILLIPFELNRVDLENQSLWLKLTREDEEFLKIFKSSREIKCFFKGAGIFIFTHSLAFRESTQTLVVEMPQTAYKKERRQDERYDIENQLKLHLDTSESSSRGVRERSKRTYRIFDISKGGLSIILSKSDRFPLNQEILSGWLAPFSIKLDLEITSVLKIRPFIYENIPYAGKKISMRFLFKAEESQKWERIWPKLLKEIV